MKNKKAPKFQIKQLEKLEENQKESRKLANKIPSIKISKNGKKVSFVKFGNRA